MVTANPPLHQSVELLGMLQELSHFILGSDVGHVVVHLISLSATSIEERNKRRNLLAESEFQRLECGLMMAEANDPIALASDGDLGELEDRIIRRGKAPVSGDLQDSRVFEIPV